MAQQKFDDPRVWASALILHSAGTGHRQLMWADNPHTATFIVSCQDCGTLFCIPAKNATHAGEHELRAAFKTAAGKDILLRMILKEAATKAAAKANRPSVWERLAGDDEF